MQTIYRLAQYRPAILRVLLAVTALLVVASTVGQLVKYRVGNDDLAGLIRLFYVSSERNVPTFYSSLLLLFAASLLALIVVDHRRREVRDVFRWTVLAIGFLYLAVDEAYGFLHERLRDPMRALLGGTDLGIFYYAWVIPGAAVVLVLAVYFLGFLRRLPAKTRVAFVAAAALYVGGAIGIELFEGRYAEVHGTLNLTFVLYATVEESLEMAGALLFIHALLQYIAEHCDPEGRLRAKQAVMPASFDARA